ncbi:MAG: hypothetical protein LBS36_00895 [Oscillospiraceae bacterium]|nr:hypothetical protein [Oscillospiraceae bacterium]
MDPIKSLRESAFLQNKRNRILLIAAGLLFAAIIIMMILLMGGATEKLFAPSLTLLSPAPVAVDNRDEINVDVLLSDLPDRVYPAASLSVRFDKNKLEFLGARQGTMMTLGDSTQEEVTYNIPIWKSDAAFANQTGELNTMYLDVTGGKFAYVREGFQKDEKDILLRLRFRLRDSAQVGEIYDITVTDAVIATIGGAETRTSLATAMRTLKAYSAKIVVQ